MTSFLVAHGAWSAGWCWKKMRPLLKEKGHDLFAPTYTGIGERLHLANADIDLETHIADMLGVLRFEDLKDAILIGHSYGGMVATAVADRVPEMLAHLVYLDAFVPRDGQSLFDLHPDEARSAMIEAAQTSGEGWRVPPHPLPPDTSPEDADWIMPRRVMQPLKTFAQPVRLTGAGESVPTTYIYCTRTGPIDIFKPFAQRAGRMGWRYLEMDASHSPHITAPEALCDVLHDIAGKLE